MKLEDDFNAMFMIVDTSNKGYLTVEEVTDFYHTLFCNEVAIDLTKAVVKKVCHGENCSVKHFQDVVMLMEEWRIREENAYWDFQSLDSMGQSFIPQSSAVFLAKSYKKDKFSLDEWNAWKNARVNNHSGIAWSDFKDFLYFESGSRPSRKVADDEFEPLYETFAKQEVDDAVDNYRFFKTSLDTDDAVAAQLLQEKQMYQESVYDEASRLVNRWNISGVEAVIHDDGIDWEIVDDGMPKDDVTMKELMTAMDEKYEILRDKLLWEMIRSKLGNDNPGMKLTQDRIEEEFTIVKSKEKSLRKNEKLEHELNTLYGFDVMQGRDLHVLMGETADAYQLRWEESQRRYAAYKSDGKTPAEINRIFEQEILDRMRNTKVTSGDLLVELWKRQKNERQHIVQRLKAIKTLSERLAVFTAIYRQCERAKEGINLSADVAHTIPFDASASGVAVAERSQSFDPSRFSEDSMRQEMLASARLQYLKRKLMKVPDVGERLKDVSQVKNLGPVDSWIEVTKLLEKKHSAEREMLIHFLQNMASFEKNLQKMSVDDQEERRNALSDMFASWKHELAGAKGKDAKVSKRPYQLALLHEGVALCKEQLKREHNHRKPAELSSVLLGQLQTLQDIQYQETQALLKQKTATEIYQIRKLEYRAIRDEHFENIAKLIFTTEKLTEEETELISLLLRKYDVLREKLFMEHGKRHHGNESKQKMVKELRGEEEKSRASRDKLHDICKRLKISYSAKEIFGPLYSRFSSGVAANKNNEKRVTIDESSLVTDQEDNILVEMHARYKDECAVLRNRIKQSSDRKAALKLVSEEQLWLLSTLQGDRSFLSSALVMGLLERAKLSGHKIRLREDIQRFVRCTQDRYPLPEPFNDEAAEIFVIENKQACETLQFLLSQHCAEWKRFRDLLKDETAEELREAASLMTSDERVKRLSEINSKRKALDINKKDDKEDLISLLEEAAALKHVIKKDILRTLVGEEGAKNEDVFVSLLADLHQEQIDDGLRWFDDVKQDPSKLGTGDTSPVEKHINACENIFQILCKYEGTADNEHLLQALEDKYDTLRDKLLSEALMRQMGEEEWKRLSERERQERLLKLKLEERRLRQEGKLDELARLLGDAFANDIRMRELLGESREEYERKLRERLAARKRGEPLSDDDLKDLEATNGSSNPLLDLQSKLDEEKAALLRMLSDQDDLYLSEKERQAALLRLRQAQLRAASEERYEAAALVSGLIDRQNAAAERLKSDRQRQQELARRRLEELRKKPRGLPILSDEDEKIVRDGDRSAMEDAVFKKLRFLQAWERAWLTSLLNDVQDPFEIVDLMSSQQVVDKLQGCHAKIPDQMIVLDQYKPLLADAALYRQAALARHVTAVTDQSRDEIKVTILADLQDSQDKEGRMLSERITEMEPAMLVDEQEKLISAIKSGSSKAVPDSLFILSSGATVEDQVIDALKGKYHAVIDSLAAKVLPEKVGIANWNKMSLEEQQAKIADLSSRVRELMDAGRYDDALDLLTEGLSPEQKQEFIDSLLGDVEERRRQDRREREQRMEERIRNGMSPEEAQRLFDEEGLKFEEKEEKRRRNVLEGLAMDFEAERDALLRALQEAKDKHDAEQRRQALLAKLRLQERLLRREENLSAIARILAISRERDDAIEKEKKRQLKLARERLEAAKRRRELGLSDPKEDVIDLRLDSDDVVVLADAVMREMEGKHAAERNALIKLMHLSGPGMDSRTKAEKLSTSECKNRIRELREMRRLWRNEGQQTLLETKDEHWEMLLEASALQMTSLCSMRSLKEEDGQAFLLADLQAEQKKETTYLLAGLLKKNPESVRRLAEVQRQARLGCWYDNVAGSLLGSTKREKQDGEEEVVKALEEKYDALKDKLLAEALMKKLGEKEWATLTEKERQRRIMQIKQKEKKLRRQGKYDDLAKLFQNLAITEQDIERIFGEQRLSQEEELKKRKDRIRQLRREKAKQGLPIDMEEIEKQVNAEEKAEKRKRTNILLTLDQNLEAEREALLAGLRKHEDAISEERRRQLAVAKLRRQRRQVEAEEKLSAIDYVLQTAKQDEETLQARHAESRERQKALAMQRLASRRNQKQKKEAVISLTNPDVIYEKLVAIANEKSEGSSTEQLLYEMEMKQSDEKEILTLLLLAADYDMNKQNEVKNMTHEQLEDELEKFSTNRRKWREERMMRAISENGDNPLTDEQRKALSKFVSAQNKILINALRHKLETACRESLEEGDMTSIKEKICAEWLADLQHTHENEIKTTTDLVGDKSEEILSFLTQGQMRARREEWIDNIGKVVFGLALPGQEQHRPSSSSSSLDQEVKEMEAEAKEKLSEYDKELLEEKKKIQRKKLQGEDVDTAAEFAALEKQFADKKAALSADIERQRRQMRERLRERRQRRDESEYEAHAAIGMVMLAEQRLKARDSRAEAEASKQRNLMQERLAARKAKRKQEQEKNLNAEKTSSEERPSSVEKPAPSPFGAMRREKTVINVTVSDKDREQVLAELHNRTVKYQEKIEKDKEEQQKLFQERLDKARKRKEDAAGEILNQFRRETTILEERKSLTLQRQKTMLVERIGQLKYERTMTMKEKQKKKAHTFSKLVDDEGTSGLDKNEKMERVAEQIQKRLVEEGGISTEEKQMEPEDGNKGDSETSTALDEPDVPLRPQTASRKLNQQEKGRIMKQRMKEKKLKRNAQEEEEAKQEENERE